MSVVLLIFVIIIMLENPTKLLQKKVEEPNRVSVNRTIERICMSSTCNNFQGDISNGNLPEQYQNYKQLSFSHNHISSHLNGAEEMEAEPVRISPKNNSEFMIGGEHCRNLSSSSKYCVRDKLKHEQEKIKQTNQIAEQDICIPSNFKETMLTSRKQNDRTSDLKVEEYDAIKKNKIEKESKSKFSRIKEMPHFEDTLSHLIEDKEVIIRSRYPEIHFVNTSGFRHSLVNPREFPVKQECFNHSFSNFIERRNDGFEEKLQPPIQPEHQKFDVASSLLPSSALEPSPVLSSIISTKNKQKYSPHQEKLEFIQNCTDVKHINKPNIVCDITTPRSSITIISKDCKSSYQNSQFKSSEISSQHLSKYKTLYEDTENSKPSHSFSQNSLTSISRIQSWIPPQGLEEPLDEDSSSGVSILSSPGQHCKKSPRKIIMTSSRVDSNITEISEKENPKSSSDLKQNKYIVIDLVESGPGSSDEAEKYSTAGESTDVSVNTLICKKKNKTALKASCNILALQNSCDEKIPAINLYENCSECAVASNKLNRGSRSEDLSYKINSISKFPLNNNNESFGVSCPITTQNSLTTTSEPMVPHFQNSSHSSQVSCSLSEPNSSISVTKEATVREKNLSEPVYVSLSSQVSSSSLFTETITKNTEKNKLLSQDLGEDLEEKSTNCVIKTSTSEAFNEYKSSKSVSGNGKTQNNSGIKSNFTGSLKQELFTTSDDNFVPKSLESVSLNTLNTVDQQSLSNNSSLLKSDVQKDEGILEEIKCKNEIRKKFIPKSNKLCEVEQQNNSVASKLASDTSHVNPKTGFLQASNFLSDDTLQGKEERAHFSELVVRSCSSDVMISENELKTVSIMKSNCGNNQAVEDQTIVTSKALSEKNETNHTEKGQQLLMTSESQLRYAEEESSALDNKYISPQLNLKESMRDNISSAIHEVDLESVEQNIKTSISKQRPPLPQRHPDTSSPHLFLTQDHSLQPYLTTPAKDQNLDDDFRSPRRKNQIPRRRLISSVPPLDQPLPEPEFTYHCEDSVDYGAFLEELINFKTLHEKLAENINKAVSKTYSDKESFSDLQNTIADFNIVSVTSASMTKDSVNGHHDEINKISTGFEEQPISNCEDKEKLQISKTEQNTRQEHHVPDALIKDVLTETESDPLFEEIIYMLCERQESNRDCLGASSESDSPRSNNISDIQLSSQQLCTSLDQHENVVSISSSVFQDQNVLQSNNRSNSIGISKSEDTCLVNQSFLVDETQQKAQPDLLQQALDASLISVEDQDNVQEHNCDKRNATDMQHRTATSSKETIGSISLTFPESSNFSEIGPVRSQVCTSLSVSSFDASSYISFGMNMSNPNVNPSQKEVNSSILKPGVILSSQSVTLPQVSLISGSVCSVPFLSISQPNTQHSFVQQPASAVWVNNSCLNPPTDSLTSVASSNSALCSLSNSAVINVKNVINQAVIPGIYYAVGGNNNNSTVLNLDSSNTNISPNNKLGQQLLVQQVMNNNICLNGETVHLAPSLQQNQLGLSQSYTQPLSSVIMPQINGARNPVFLTGTQTPIKMVTSDLQYLTLSPSQVLGILSSDSAKLQVVQDGIPTICNLSANTVMCEPEQDEKTNLKKTKHHLRLQRNRTRGKSMLQKVVQRKLDVGGHAVILPKVISSQTVPPECSSLAVHQTKVRRCQKSSKKSVNVAGRENQSQQVNVEVHPVEVASTKVDKKLSRNIADSEMQNKNGTITNKSETLLPRLSCNQTSQALVNSWQRKENFSSKKKNSHTPQNLVLSHQKKHSPQLRTLINSARVLVGGQPNRQRHVRVLDFGPEESKCESEDVTHEISIHCKHKYKKSPSRRTSRKSKLVNHFESPSEVSPKITKESVQQQQITNSNSHTASEIQLVNNLNHVLTIPSLEEESDKFTKIIESPKIKSRSKLTDVVTSSSTNDNQGKNQLENVQRDSRPVSSNHFDERNIQSRNVVCNTKLKNELIVDADTQEVCHSVEVQNGLTSDVKIQDVLDDTEIQNKLVNIADTQEVCDSVEVQNSFTCDAKIQDLPNDSKIQNKLVYSANTQEVCHNVEEQNSLTSDVKIQDVFHDAEIQNKLVNNADTQEVSRSVQVQSTLTDDARTQDVSHDIELQNKVIDNADTQQVCPSIQVQSSLTYNVKTQGVSPGIKIHNGLIDNVDTQQVCCSVQVQSNLTGEVKIKTKNVSHDIELPNELKTDIKSNNHHLIADTEQQIKSFTIKAVNSNEQLKDSLIGIQTESKIIENDLEKKEPVCLSLSINPKPVVQNLNNSTAKCEELNDNEIAETLVSLATQIPQALKMRTTVSNMSDSQIEMSSKFSNVTSVSDETSGQDSSRDFSSCEDFQRKKRKLGILKRGK
ncbi:uncharacterized protein LOC143258572 [Tachypleus tridentatus]|uniref:uncharacterized protein LOC143258572 n=1 Tax=Tachypleus tridentatus TaxID=6853 RepID=UPI003FD19CCE